MYCGVREQLAAALVQRNDGTQNGCLVVHGTPGDWSVAVQDRGPSFNDTIWLAAARTPSVPRSFKSLDAAYEAAQAIHTMADPAQEKRLIEVRILGSKE